MGKRRPWLVIAVLLFSFEARTDDHKADFSVASPSYIDGSSLWGVHVSVGLMAQEPKPKKQRPGTSEKEESLGEALVNPKKWGVMGDLSAYSGRDGEHATRVVFLVGPRITFHRRTPKDPSHKKLMGFLQLLSGVIHTRDRAGKTLAIAGNSTEPVVGLGGGADFLFSTDPYRTWGVRAQLDLLWRYDAFSEKPIKRASVGAIYRFHGHH